MTKAQELEREDEETEDDELSPEDLLSYILAGLTGLFGGSVGREVASSDEAWDSIESSFRNGAEMRKRIVAIEDLLGMFAANIEDAQGGKVLDTYRPVWKS